MTNRSGDLTSSTEVNSPLLGPDPGPTIRRWVALLLRLGVGLGLLNAGLIGYMGLNGPNASQSNMTGAFGPFYSAVPYIQIALGMALILGFLLTPAAIGAGLFTLLGPVLVTIEVLASGATSPAGMNPYQIRGNANVAAMMLGAGGTLLTLPALLTHAALIWLSPMANHPYSIDALIFGRVAPEPFRVPPPIAEAPTTEG